MKNYITYAIVNEEGFKYYDVLEKFVPNLGWNDGCLDRDWLEDCMASIQQTFPNEKFEIVVHYQR